MKSKIKGKIQKGWLLVGISAALLTFILATTIYSLNFLSDKILPVLSSGTNGEGTIQFDLQGFEELGL